MIWWNGFQPHSIDSVWDRAVPLLRLGFEAPERADKLKDKCKDGSAQLWCIFDGGEILAAFVTEIVTVGGRTICNVISIGGTRMNEWLRFLSSLETWAREQSCVAMQFDECRLGWARILKDYSVKKIILEKEL